LIDSPEHRKKARQTSIQSGDQWCNVSMSDECSVNLSANRTKGVNRLRRAFEAVSLYTALALLGVICLAWTVVAFPALLVLPEEAARRFGQLGIRAGFRVFIWALGALGVYRFDLRVLHTLHDSPALILAPNHPTIIDALLIIAFVPRVTCVMKPSLMNSVFLGAGARLARYIPAGAPRRMIKQAVAELRRGGMVLLFPEGTRTRRAPLNVLQDAVGIIAKEAAVPVQTLIIETDSPYLSKGWSLFRPVSLPVNYRMRLGETLQAPTDVRSFTILLDRTLRRELSNAPQNEWLKR
jgi:1-acyl-sn-glycerol-3-phosphate acyltransferase